MGSEDYIRCTNFIFKACIVVTLILIPVACFRNPDPPVIKTEILDSSFTQVVIRSDIYSDGGSEILKSGVCWSTRPSPTPLDSYYENYERKPVFINTLNGIADSTFYIRSFAINRAGLTYGNEVSFFFRQPGTVNQPPIIQLDRPGNNSIYVTGEAINIGFSPYDPEGRIDRIEVYANDSLIATLKGIDVMRWAATVAGNYEIFAKVFDDKEAAGVSNKVTVTVMRGIAFNGIIPFMVRSEDDELIFGYNKNLNNLVLINPVKETLTEIPLPFSKAIAMDYSVSDKKLYILYQSAGIISVWDKTTQSFSGIAYAYNSVATDFNIDSENRRIYILSDKGFFTIDMDSGKVLSSDTTVEGQIMSVDPARRFIFTSYTNSCPTSFFKYSASSDTIKLLETLIFYNDYARGIEVNSLYEYVVLYGHVFSIYNTYNINELTGTIDMGVGPKYLIFTADNKTILSANSDIYDEHIYIIDAKSFSQVARIYCPYSNCFSSLMSNYSGSKIAAFTYDDFSDNKYRIYFFDLPK